MDNLFSIYVLNTLTLVLYWKGRSWFWGRQGSVSGVRKGFRADCTIWRLHPNIGIIEIEG